MPETKLRLRQWRDFRGMSATDLAKASGYSRSHIFKTEKGEKKYTQPFLERMAQVLGCREADLLERDPSILDDLTPEEARLLAELLASWRSRNNPQEL